KSYHKAFSTQAKTGRLRLVRQGSTIFYYATEGLDDTFTLLQQFPFSAADIEDVRLVASTGGPKAALDVRVSDLSIKAEAVQGAAEAASPPAAGKGWLGIALALVVASAVGLGALIAVRQSRRGKPAANPEQPAEAARNGSPTFSFPCAGCGRK